MLRNPWELLAALGSKDTGRTLLGLQAVFRWKGYL